MSILDGTWRHSSGVVLIVEENGNGLDKTGRYGRVRGLWIIVVFNLVAGLSSEYAKAREVKRYDVLLAHLRLSKPRLPPPRNTHRNCVLQIDIEALNI